MVQNIQLNRSKLSPKIIAVLDKFKNNRAAFEQLKNGYLKIATHKVMQDSMIHDTFCDYFKAPKKMPPLLLKLYGLNERELQHEFEQFNLKGHRVYTDPYYQTLLLAYLIGLDQNDAELRQYALALISILIWNYYKLTYFKKVCNPEIARYALNYELKNNNTFKKHGTPFQYITKLTIPQLEAKYPQEIAKDPTAEMAGLRRIITTIRSRFNQLFKGIAKAYYNAYEKGAREGTQSLYGKAFEDSNEMVEKAEHFSNIVEQISDKILKIAALKKNVISQGPVKDLLYRKFFLGNSQLKQIDKFVEDEENHEDLKYFIELLIGGIKPKREEDICQYNVEVLANKITSAKKEEYFIKLKELSNGITDVIFGKSPSTQTEYRNRKIVLLALIAYIKYLFCKRV